MEHIQSCEANECMLKLDNSIHNNSATDDYSNSSGTDGADGTRISSGGKCNDDANETRSSSGGKCNNNDDGTSSEGTTGDSSNDNNNDSSNMEIIPSSGSNMGHNGEPDNGNNIIHDDGSGRGGIATHQQTSGGGQTSLQTGGSSPWRLEEEGKASRSPSVSPPLTSSDFSSTQLSVTGSSNHGDTGSISSVDFDESSSSPDVLVLTELETSNGRGNGNCSTSWMNNAETCQQEDRAAFNRVVGDAPQRAHIRLKARHHGKGDKTARSDESSDSSSSNRDSPPNVLLNLSEIGGSKQNGDDNVESEGSSGSVFFRPASKNPKDMLSENLKVKAETSKQRDGSNKISHMMHDEDSLSSPGNDGNPGNHGSHSNHGNSNHKSSKSGMSSSSHNTADSGYNTHQCSFRRSSAAHVYISQDKESTAAIDHEASTSNFNGNTDVEYSEKREQRKRKRHSLTHASPIKSQTSPNTPHHLLDLTMQTSTLMVQTQQMQEQLDTLRRETRILYDVMIQLFSLNRQCDVPTME